MDWTSIAVSVLGGGGIAVVAQTLLAYRLRRPLFREQVRLQRAKADNERLTFLNALIERQQRRIEQQQQRIEQLEAEVNALKAQIRAMNENGERGTQ